MDKGNGHHNNVIKYLVDNGNFMYVDISCHGNLNYFGLWNLKVVLLWVICRSNKGNDQQNNDKTYILNNEILWL